jgi:tetratricopeptide (TPR) repeat protein
MSLSHPKHTKKFPTYVHVPSYEALERSLVNPTEDAELEKLFAIDQVAQQRMALKFAEDTLRKKDLKAFKAEELCQFIKELHRIATCSLVLLKHGTQSGNYSTKRIWMRRETGRKDLIFDPGYPFSLNNYKILQQIYGIAVADSYKSFCEILAKKLSTISTDELDVVDVIFESQLDKHLGYKAFSLIDEFGEKPQNIEKAMHEFCTRLLLKLQDKHADPFDCAAYALFRFCKIHPFVNGNGTIGRMLMNCVLIEFGINPLGIGNHNKHDYYQAIESSTLDNLEPLKTYIKHSSAVTYSKSQNEPLFPGDIPSIFSLNWAKDNSSYCMVYPVRYEVVSNKNYQRYCSLRTTMHNEGTPMLQKIILTSQVNKLIDFNVDADYCESKGARYEKSAHLLPAAYYYQRAAGFCHESKQYDEEKRLNAHSKKLLLQHAAKKAGMEEKSKPSLPEPGKERFAPQAKENGNGFFRAGDYKKAVACYQRAIRLQPDFSVGWFNLGCALQKLNRSEEARHYWQKALDLDPTYEKAKQKLRA